MVEAVVFQLAVQPELPTPAEAPEWGVLARQLPRLMVQALNGTADRGVRFFPFIGADHGRRGFLHVPGLLPVATLEGLHQQRRVRLLVDGLLGEGTWRLRIVDSASGATCFDDELPFDPVDPLPATVRALFELTGALGWSGAPAPLPAPPAGPALAPFLMGRDDLLAVEASLLSADPRALIEHTLVAVQRGMADPNVRDHCLEFAALLVRHGGFEAAAGELIATACDHLPGEDREFLFAAGAVLELSQRQSEAAGAYDRAAAAGHPDAGARAVAVAAAAGDFDRARHLGEQRLARGEARTAELVGQLAAVADRQGDRATRDALCAELIGLQPLAPLAARQVLAYLLDGGRTEEAVAIGERTLASHPGDGAETAGLWLELGRAKLLLGAATAAQQALQRAIALGADPDVEADARRLLRFAATPALLDGMMAAERALARGDIKGARDAVRHLVRSHRDRGESWLVAGMVEQRRGKLRRAERAYRRALDRDAELADARNRLGILLVARGRTQEGHGHLTEAVRVAPADPTCRLHLAQACKLMGREREGREHLLAAERLGADPAKVRHVRRQFFSDAG